MADMRKMTIGQIVDYCIEYQNRQYEIEKKEEKEEKQGKKRKATQADWDSFFG